MIPKIIHYCWFGGNPLPEDAKKCIESWKEYCPGYEIKEWNESNFDMGACDYIKEAYKARKWAFVSDYVRFVVLYKYGGVYFDTDVELIKPIDDIVERGPFMGVEGGDIQVNPGLGLAVTPGLGLYKELIDTYDSVHFIDAAESKNIKTVVQFTTELLVEKGLKRTKEIQYIEGVYIYPKEYFSPYDLKTGKTLITENTRSIHHYTASWCDAGSKKRGKIYRFICRVFGKPVADGVKKVWHKIK